MTRLFASIVVSALVSTGAGAQTLAQVVNSGNPIGAFGEASGSATGSLGPIVANSTAPVWQWSFAATGALPTDGSVVVNSPSLGGLVTDSTGALTYKPNNLLLYSNTPGGIGWANEGTVSTNSTTDPLGGNTASTWTATAQYQTLFTYAASYTPGGTYILSGWVKVLSGASNLRFSLWDGVASQYKNITPTTTWQRFQFVVTIANNASVLGFGFRDYSAAEWGTYALWGYQIRAVTYQTVDPDFFPTTASAYYGPAFNYQQGLSIWEQRVNYFLNSAVGATQNVTTAAVPYTLSCWGTGTITLTGTSTAGPLTCSGATPTSSVTPTSLTFTPTAGSLTLTVAGSATYVNLEQAAFPGPRILTGSVGAVTASADSVTLTGPPLTVLGGSAVSAIAEGIAFSTDYSTGHNTLVATNTATPLYMLATGGSNWNGTTGISAPPAVGPKAVVRAGTAWGPSGRSVVTAGSAVVSDGQTLVPATTASLGSGGGSFYWNGDIRSLALYNSRLSDSLLKSKSIVGAPY